MGGALEARGIPAGGGRLRTEVTGEIELDGKVLVIKRVHAHYTLQIDADADHDKIERAHRHHADYCPVARSIRDAIDITTSLELVESE